MIVAAGTDGSIGIGGNLIWRIPADLRRFKALTMHHPVVMGRKTWESLPKSPLPGRLNIVLTRRANYEAPGAVVVGSVEEALAAISAGDGDSSEAFVMGGAEIYREFLPFVSRIYLTEIDDKYPDADARLPLVWKEEGWSVTERSDAATTPECITYRYVTYERK